MKIQTHKDIDIFLQQEDDQISFLSFVYNENKRLTIHSKNFNIVKTAIEVFLLWKEDYGTQTKALKLISPSEFIEITVFGIIQFQDKYYCLYSNNDQLFFNESKNNNFEEILLDNDRNRLLIQNVANIFSNIEIIQKQIYLKEEKINHYEEEIINNISQYEKIS